MIVCLAMLAVGLALSALFSGSETGFYRATRVRLVIDARDGSWTSRGLLMLANNPALFVATTLVGNNVANYITSLAVVLLTQRLVPIHGNAVELTATVLFSPSVFVYGELLPKHLFYHKPNLLLRRCGPLVMVFAVLFSPIAITLAALGYGLQRILGETPLRVRSRLEKKELQAVLREGQEVGVLQPAQWFVARQLIETASLPISRFMVPAARIATIQPDAARVEAVKIARRRKASVLVVKATGDEDYAGYFRVADLCLSEKATVGEPRPLISAEQTDSLIHVLQRLQKEKADLAAVIDRSGKTTGFVRAQDLAEHLFRDEL